MQSEKKNSANTITIHNNTWFQCPRELPHSSATSQPPALPHSLNLMLGGREGGQVRVGSENATWRATRRPQPWAHRLRARRAGSRNGRERLRRPSPGLALDAESRWGGSPQAPRGPASGSREYRRSPGQPPATSGRGWGAQPDRWKGRQCGVASSAGGVTRLAPLRGRGASAGTDAHLLRARRRGSGPPGPAPGSPWMAELPPRRPPGRRSG